MKRFHIHVSVDDLTKSIGFYSTLFGAEPTRIETDYAKWMLEDPRMNFAISTGRQPVGVNHLGFQVDSAEGAQACTRSWRSGRSLDQESEQACCYAKSDKYWVTDPTGIAGDVPYPRQHPRLWRGYARVQPRQLNSPDTRRGAGKQAGCCVPKAKSEPKAEQSGCCAK